MIRCVCGFNDMGSMSSATLWYIEPDLCNGVLQLSQSFCWWAVAFYSLFHVAPHLVNIFFCKSPGWERAMLNSPRWNLTDRCLTKSGVFGRLTSRFLSGVPDFFDRNKILSGGDLSHYQVPHCIRVFFYFVWFVFIHHNFQFYFELCTYCNILDIYLS